MNFIDKLILNRGQKQLSRINTQIELSLKDGYKVQAPFLETLYTNAAYWHGTGRYHYKHTEGSRYGGTDHTATTHLLASMIEKGGLAPHKDPWIKVKGKYIASISLTPFRMYGRLYADLHQNEHNPLLYKYGDTKFWFNFFVRVQIAYKKFAWHFLSYSLPQLLKPSTYGRMREWMRAVRSDLTTKPIPVFKSYSLQSDIPGNYGILIGIKKQAVSPLPIKSGYTRLETRTATLIPFSDMTHIEVPLENMKETEELLRSKGINVKVIPIEYGELYCSNFSLKELAYDKR